MSSETFPPNLMVLINIATVYIFQYVAQDSKFTTVGLTWLVNGIVQKLWPKEARVKRTSFSTHRLIFRLPFVLSR